MFLLLITAIPRIERKTPRRTLLGSFLFKTNVSKKITKRGARVPKSVALAIETSFTAEKKQAKWSPRKTPATAIVFLCSFGRGCCGKTKLKREKIIDEINILQKAAEVAGKLGK